MNTTVPAPKRPNRILYTMLRVADLDRSIDFYSKALGLKEVRRETFPDGEFTLVFLGYGDSEDEALIELTYNWGSGSYNLGNGYGHIAFEVDDIYATQAYLESIDIPMTRPAGPMMFAPEETGHKEIIAFFEDPDGYKIELIETAGREI